MSGPGANNNRTTTSRLGRRRAKCGGNEPIVVPTSWRRPIVNIQPANRLVPLVRACSSSLCPTSSLYSYTQLFLRGCLFSSCRNRTNYILAPLFNDVRYGKFHEARKSSGRRVPSILLCNRLKMRKRIRWSSLKDQKR